MAKPCNGTRVPFYRLSKIWRVNLPQSNERSFIVPVLHLQLDAVGAFDDRLDDAVNDSTRRQADNDAVADPELSVIGLFVGWHKSGWVAGGAAL